MTRGHTANSSWHERITLPWSSDYFDRPKRPAATLPSGSSAFCCPCPWPSSGLLAPSGAEASPPQDHPVHLIWLGSPSPFFYCRGLFGFVLWFPPASCIPCCGAAAGPSALQRRNQPAVSLRRHSSGARVRTPVQWAQRQACSGLDHEIVFI